MLLGRRRQYGVRRGRWRKVFRQGLEQILIIGQYAGGGGLFDDGLDDLHLVPAPLIITIGEGMALPGEHQGLQPVKMVPALGIAIGPIAVARYIPRRCGKGIVGIQ